MRKFPRAQALWKPFHVHPASITINSPLMFIGFALLMQWALRDSPAHGMATQKKSQLQKGCKEIPMFCLSSVPNMILRFAKRTSVLAYFKRDQQFSAWLSSSKSSLVSTLEADTTLVAQCNAVFQCFVCSVGPGCAMFQGESHIVSNFLHTVEHLIWRNPPTQCFTSLAELAYTKKWS